MQQANKMLLILYKKRFDDKLKINFKYNSYLKQDKTFTSSKYQQKG